jgi:tRNA G18 (ribose-2'-O)-methylase SpoU
MSWHRLSPDLFQVLDVFGTGSPLLQIKTPRMSTWAPEEGFQDGLSVLIPFQDPENVGAVIRSAVAFGATRIILLAECAHPYHPKAIRASGGAVLYAPIVQGPSLHDLPSDASVLALSPEGEDISRYSFPRAFGVLPGIEGIGLPDHLRQKAFSIPIRNDVDSLNAAAATAIVMYLWNQSGNASK